MKTRTWMVASSVSVLLLSCASGVAAQEGRLRSALMPISGFGEFVGVTTAKVTPGSDGVAGIFSLARACQAQFRQSHVCSSAEILASGRIPEFPEAVWVNPSIVSIVKQPTAYDELGLVDASGVVYMADQLSGGLNCSQWRGGYLREGLVLEPSGVFGTRFCDSSLAIACCSSLTR